MRALLLALPIALAACAAPETATDPSGFEGPPAPLPPPSDVTRSLVDQSAPLAVTSTPVVRLPGPARPADRLDGQFVAVDPTLGRVQGADGAALASPAGMTLANVMRQTARDVNALLALPADVEVRAAACDTPNAFYTPQTREITLCDAFAAHVETTLRARVPEAAERHGYLYGTLEFATLHHIAQALIDAYALPVSGAPEQAADAIAVFLARDSGALERLTGSLVYWTAAQHNGPSAKAPVQSEHGFDTTRLASIACLAYGASPQANAWLAGSPLLPLDPASDDGARRLAACEGDFQAAAQDLSRHLEPHLQPEVRALAL